MIRRGLLDPVVIGLALICALLGAAIGAEAMLLPWGINPLEEPSAGSVEEGADELAVGSNELLVQLAPLSALQEIVKRTLFDDERRPAAVEESAPVSRRGDQLAAQWRLTGVVQDEANSVAILQDRKAARALRLTVGSSVDGWKVARIAGDRIELTSGRENVELLLREPVESAQRPPKKL